MKIFSIAGNYGRESSGNEPIHWDLLADSALLKEGKPLFIPDFADSFMLYPSLAIRISRVGKTVSRRFARRYFDAVAVGLNLRADRLLAELRGKGLPASMALSFDGAAPIGRFINAEAQDDLQAMSFTINAGGKEHIWKGERLAHTAEEIIEAVSFANILRTGDIIFVGLSSEGFPPERDTHVDGFFRGDRVLSFNIK